MSAPNINQITSQFARMSDQQIQQYAAMHKNDPYTMSLALSEMNRRKETRSAQMGQQQQQPKVVDQAIAGMSQGLPEDSGLALLSTGGTIPMQYADGGIVAFDKGGDVDAAKARQQAAQSGLYTFGVLQRRQNPQEFAAAQQEMRDADMARSAADAAYEQEMQDTGQRVFKRPVVQAPTPLAAPTVAPTAAPASAPTATASAAPPTTTAQGPGITALVPPAKTSNRPPATMAPAAAPTVKEEPLAYTPRTAEDIRKTADLMSKSDLDEIQANYKPYAEQFKADRERLAKREEGNYGNALIRAGLGMMQSRGQGLSGLAEGAAQGFNVFQEAQKADDASRKAMTQSEMLMTQAQRAERQGARRDAVALTNQAGQEQKNAVELAQRAQQIKNTADYQGVMGRAATTTAGAAVSRANALGSSSGVGLGIKQDALTLTAYKAQLADISKQITELGPRINLPANKALKDQLIAERQRISAGIAALTPQGTIPPVNPPAGSGSGTTVDFMTGKPI